MRRFVLLMLLAWLPIQASAMPWLAFQCDQHDSGLHSHAAQHADHSHHAAPGNHGAAEGGDSDAAMGIHSCCHHYSVVVHSLPILAGVAASAGVAPRLPAHLYEFVPDLPKRPPLAHLV